MRYEPIEERVFLSALPEAEGRREKARKVCASTRSKFAWMKLNVCASREGGVTYPIVNGTDRAVEILRDLHATHSLLLQETFSVLLLSAPLEPIGFAVVAVGGLSSVNIEMASMFRPAVLLPASAMILCHNHPSGRATPSADDDAFTAKAAQVGRLLGVRVVDHIVLTDSAHFSYAGAGKMP